MQSVNLVHVVFDRSAQNPTEDSAIFTLHLRGTAVAAPDTLRVLDDSDRLAFANKVGTFFDGIKTLLTAKMSLVAIKFYEMPDAAGGLMGPPKYIKTYSAPGSSVGQVLPPQLSMSVTFKHPSTGGVGKTNSRWGRIYVPGVTAAALDSNGRFSTSATDTVANAAQVMMQPFGTTTGGKGTIWSRKAWAHFDPKTVQVDDVPDVIRSRRFSTTNYRKKLDI